MSLLFVASALFAPRVDASTTIEYEAACTYTGWDKTVRYSGRCAGNWGVYMHENGTVIVRYIMTMPGDHELVVYIYENGLASVNGIPAKQVDSVSDLVTLVTAEGETYTFTRGGESE